MTKTQAAAILARDARAWCDTHPGAALDRRLIVTRMSEFSHPYYAGRRIHEAAEVAPSWRTVLTYARRQDAVLGVTR